MEEGSDTSSSYYVFTERDDNSSYIDTFDLEFAVELEGDTNSNVSSIEGPSLIFLYTIVPSGFSSVSSLTSKFQTQFSSDYINSNTGRAISSSDDEVLSITYLSETYPMYKFHLYDSSTDDDINEQQPTEYGLFLKETLTSSTTYSSEFGFQYSLNTNTDYFQIVMDQIDSDKNFYASGSVITDGISLRPYDDDYFSAKWDGDDSGHSDITNNSDYDIVIYSALNVSDGDGFTNIFWSTLNEVATIPSDGA
jgi:hypothetical protein